MWSPAAGSWRSPQAAGLELGTGYKLSKYTCWFASSEATEVKYKRKVKYIKVLIRCPAWFSLRLSWFLLCPGRVGSVLIFMASGSLMCCYFQLVQASPHFLSRVSLDRTVIIDIGRNPHNQYVHENSFTSQRASLSPLSSISFHWSLHPLNRKPEPWACNFIF